MNAALPTILGVLLVALAAAAALLPLLRGTRPEPATAPVVDPAEAERFELYRQVIELEFDQQTGKLSSEDFEALTRELLGRAGQLLHARQAAAAATAEGEAHPAAATPDADIDAEVEREIAAARKAFARARRKERRAEEVAS